MHLGQHNRRIVKQAGIVQEKAVWANLAKESQN